MGYSVSWFIGLAVLAVGMLLLGRRLGQGKPIVSNLALVVAVVAVGCTAILRFRPVLLHLYLPLELSIWLEGVVGVFPWMLLVGVLSSGQTTQRLRRAAPLMIILGVVAYLFGGIWMLLPTKVIGEPEQLSPVGVILQNEADSCVPASVAYALRLMDVPATEASMCKVVLAKPTRGSTPARVTYGLREYLRQYNLGVRLRDVTAAEAVDLATWSKPVLVVIRSGIAADHMVTLLGRTDDGNVLIANPSPGVHGGIPALPSNLGHGLEVYAPKDFARLYRRGAVVFEDIS